MPNVHDFPTAEAYLAGGKSKTDRPLCNNTRLIRLDADTIGVRLHNTIVVAYHQDGTQTIATGGWWTLTTKERIHRFSTARVGRFRFPGDKYTTGVIFHTSDPLSPPRVQRCRTCHGSRGALSLEYLPYKVEGPRNLLWRDCYRCSGAGRVDYGSVPQPTPWSGSPVKVDATGKVLGGGIGWTASLDYHSPKPVKADIGATVQGALGDLLPGFRAYVACPTCGASRGREWASRPLNSVVVHLNDSHKWSREAIADWLETLDVDLRFPTPREEVTA